MRKFKNWWRQRQDNRQCKVYSEFYKERCALRAGHKGNHRPSRETGFVEWSIDDEGLERPNVNLVPPTRSYFAACIEGQRDSLPEESMSEEALERMARDMDEALKDSKHLPGWK